MTRCIHIALACLAAGCSAIQSAPRMVTAGGHASVLSSTTTGFVDVLLVPRGKTDFAIVYMPTINASNYLWSVHSKTNLSQSAWQDEPVNQPDTNTIVHASGRPALFMRLKGTWITNS